MRVIIYHGIIYYERVKLMGFVLDKAAVRTIMMIIAAIVLIIRFVKKKNTFARSVLIFVSVSLYIFYFNWLFPDIPLSGEPAMPWLGEFYLFGQILPAYSVHPLSRMDWIRLSYILRDNIIPALGFIGIGLCNTLLFSKHRKFKGAILICIAICSVQIIYPLLTNLFWGGVVWVIMMMNFYAAVALYLLGTVLGKITIKVTPKILKPLEPISNED